jgi:hypothetical protein
MIANSFYRRIIRLYPRDFRQQFSDEMSSVLQQRADDGLTRGKAAATLLFLKETTSIVKGACFMWMAKLFSVSASAKDPLPSEPRPTPTLSELAAQRQLAIRQMVAAIAKHNFSAARAEAQEESRLKSLIAKLESEAPTAGTRTA